MPQFEIRCNTKRVLAVEADDERSAVETAEHTDFSDWDSTDSPYSVRRLDAPAEVPPHVREMECGSHVLRIDVRLFRSQRELLTRITDLARQGQPYSPGPEDGPLLDGLLELTDELFDAAEADDEAERQVAELVEHAERVSAPEDALDDLVHDVAQDVGLGDLNELDDPDEQESHIGSVEESASRINNGGLEEQLRFLLKQGVSPERIRKELDATE